MDWPEALSSGDGQKFTPREILGNKLEALNKLRMQDRIWITLLPTTGNWQVEIAGDDIQQVDEAKEHFLTLIAKMHADTFGVQDACNIILDRLEGLEVELYEGGYLEPNNTNTAIIPRLLPHHEMNNPGDFRHQELHATQLAGLRYAINASLENVRHRSGTYDFVVRLGSLALSGVDEDRIGHTYSKQSFLKAIEGTVKLNVKKWYVVSCKVMSLMLIILTGLQTMSPDIASFVVS